MNVNPNVDFTVSSLDATEKDIPINLCSSNTHDATVPATLTLKTGSKEVFGQISYDITISADGVDIAVSTVKRRAVEKLDPL